MQSPQVVGMGLVCLCVAGTGGGLTPLAQGETTGSTEASAAPARLDSVVVTGTQISVPVSELPAAVTVIDRDEIDSRQVTDVFQLLRTVPGLSVTQTGSRGGVTAVFPRGGNANFNLVLIAGVRVEDSSVFGVDTNPRVSASYTLPWPQTKLRGGYATGIRAPSFVEEFGTGSPLVVGNRNLKSEESLSWEIGLDQPFLDGRALLSATHFHNRYKDLIAFVSGPGPNFQNVSEAEASGIETGFQVFLNLAGSYAVLQNVWPMRSLRLQLKFDNLLNKQYEQAIGFSAPGISVRGGVAMNF